MTNQGILNTMSTPYLDNLSDDEATSHNRARMSYEIGSHPDHISNASSTANCDFKHNESDDTRSELTFDGSCHQMEQRDGFQPSNLPRLDLTLQALSGHSQMSTTSLPQYRYDVMSQNQQIPLSR